MTKVEALITYLQGENAHRRQANRVLAGSLLVSRMNYVGGHPAIPSPRPLWVGQVGGRLRLVDEQGERTYEIPLDRVSGVTYDPSGQVQVRFEPTAGQVATVLFQAGEEAAESYWRLLRLLLASA